MEAEASSSDDSITNVAVKTEVILCFAARNRRENRDRYGIIVETDSVPFDFSQYHR